MKPDEITAKEIIEDMHDLCCELSLSRIRKDLKRELEIAVMESSIYRLSTYTDLTVEDIIKLLPPVAGV